MGIRIGIGSLKIGQGSTGVDWSSYLTQQYQAVYDAMTEKPSVQDSYIWSRMVYKLIDAGLWDGFDVFDFLGAHSSAESLKNWKTPGTFDPTLDGSPAFEAYKGFTGATNKCINLNFNPSTDGDNYKANDASIYIVSQTAGILAGAATEVGVSVGGIRTELLMDYDVTGGLALINTPSNASMPIASATGKGHYFLDRSPDAPVAPDYDPKIYGAVFNRKQYVSAYTETPQLPNGNLYALARNTGATRDRFSSRQITLVAIGRYFSLAEQNIIISIVEEALSARSAGTLGTPTIATSNYLTKTTIPLTTYDGSDQTIHPSMVDCLTQWNGYRYWMANTPFVSGGTGPNIENPSVWASNDGVTWVVPAGLTNPVVPKPGTFNADCDLYFENNTMYLIWREWVATYGNIYMLKSTDGITWTDKTLICSPGDGLGDTECASPGIVKIAGTYYMYYVNMNGTNYINIKRRACATIDGNYVSPEVVDYPVLYSAAAQKYWHMDVMVIGAKIYLFASTGANSVSNSSTLISIGSSTNGINFNIEGVCPVWVTDSEEIKGFYRPSPLNSDYLYYSSQNGNSEWLTRRINMSLL